MILDLGIYDAPVAEVENFEMDGDSLALTRAAAIKVAEQEAGDD